MVPFDLVGSGGSDLSAYDRERYASVEGYAEDLVEIALEFSDGPCIFVGHSVSAMIGVLADLQADDLFAAHIMVGPSPSYIDDEDYVGGFSRGDIESLLDTMDGNYLGWSSNMAPTIMGAPSQPELGVELTNSFCRTDPEIARQFARVTFLTDVREHLPAVRRRPSFFSPTKTSSRLLKWGSTCIASCPEVFSESSTTWGTVRTSAPRAQAQPRWTSSWRRSTSEHVHL